MHNTLGTPQCTAMNQCVYISKIFVWPSETFEEFSIKHASWNMCVKQKQFEEQIFFDLTLIISAFLVTVVKKEGVIYLSP